MKNPVLRRPKKQYRFRSARRQRRGSDFVFAQQMAQGQIIMSGCVFDFLIDLLVPVGGTIHRFTDNGDRFGIHIALSLQSKRWI